jgi:hypothetical protein
MIGQSPVLPESTEQVDSGTQPPTGGATPALPREIGGREGPEPTRYGDWEKNGRCVDF